MRFSACCCRTLFTACACLAFVGCVNPGQLYDNFATGDELARLPEDWSGEFIAASVTTSWISELGSDELSTLAQQALQNNFLLRSQAELVGQRYAQADAASGGRLPNLDAAFNLKRSAANTQLSPGEYVYLNAFDASLRLSWNPDLWGQLAADARAAAYQLEAAIASYQYQRSRQIANLANNWVALVTCNQRVALNDERIERAEELLNAANQGYALGLEPLLSVRNQELVLAGELRAQLKQQQQCRQLERTIALGIGAATGTRIETPQILPPLAATPAAGLPANLLTHRGDLIESRAKLKAAYEGIAGARAARFPSLVLSANVGRNSDNLGTLFSDNINTFSIAAGLAIPLYAFGRLEAQEQAQRSVAAQAEIAYVEAVYNAITEVENLLDAEAILVQSIQLAERGYELASDSAEIAEQQYAAGTSDFSSWVSAEITRFSNLSTILSLTMEQWQTRIKLYLALGSSPLSHDEYDSSAYAQPARS